MRKRPQTSNRNRPAGGNARARAQQLFVQGLGLHQIGQLEEAAEWYERALIVWPKHCDALHLLGVVAAQTQNHQRAVMLIDQAIEINPKSAAAYNHRGLALQELKQLDAAVASLDKALALEPTYVEAHYNRGNVLRELKQLGAAVASYDKAIALQPDFAEAYINRGVALKELEQPGAAVASYDKAIALKPNSAVAYSNRGNALKELRQLDAAVASYDKAIALKLDYADAHFNRGNALKELKQLDAALASYDRAVALRPDFAEAYYNRGNALKDLQQLDAAVASLNKVIALQPDFAEAYYNRGLALQELTQLDEALASYDKAIALKPDYTDAYWNKSLLLLLGGNFEKGWELYEWRWKRAEMSKYKHRIQRRRWNGAHFNGHLMILPEQGLGDEIFFMGMLHQVRERVSSVTVSMDARLLPLFQRSFETIKFISRETLLAGQDYDVQIYMGSLGRYFRSSVEDFNNVKSGYLRACGDRAGKLRQRIAKGTSLICGVSWVSKRDDFGAQKSLRLSDLKSILSLENYEFIDLQYGDTTAEQSALREKSGIELTRIPEIDNFGDIDGLAALISACDVVVTVSNTTAHLAAALGKPVFIILPFGPGLLYYWQLDRSDTPWYPSAKLYRQERMGDWGGALARVRADLQKLARG